MQTWRSSTAGCPAVSVGLSPSPSASHSPRRSRYQCRLVPVFCWLHFAKASPLSLHPCSGRFGQTTQDYLWQLRLLCHYRGEQTLQEKREGDLQGRGCWGKRSRTPNTATQAPLPAPLPPLRRPRPGSFSTVGPLYSTLGCTQSCRCPLSWCRVRLASEEGPFSEYLTSYLSPQIMLAASALPGLGKDRATPGTSPSGLGLPLSRNSWLLNISVSTWFVSCSSLPGHNGIRPCHVGQIRQGPVKAKWGQDPL